MKRSAMDEATRRAYDEGPFGKILRAAAESNARQAEAAAARKPLSAAVFVDTDVSRDSVERMALAHLAETAPDAEYGEKLMRDYAKTQLRRRWRGLDATDWDWLEAQGALAGAPLTRQPSLPKPIGDGKDWKFSPKKKRNPAPKRVAAPDLPCLQPLPGWLSA